jgi:S-DNA-T family DNA segregation ATPase FtsK/SpoIIIE
VETRVARDIWAIGYITLAVLTYLSLWGQIGAFGEAWEAAFRYTFGIGIGLIPVVLLAVGVTLLTAAKVQFSSARVLGICLLVASFLGYVHIDTPKELWLSGMTDAGGAVGFVMASILGNTLEVLGGKIVLFALFLSSILLIFGVSLSELIDFVLGRTPATADELAQSLSKALDKKSDFKINQPAEVKTAKEAADKAVEAKPETAKKSEEFRINRPAQVKLASDFKPQKSRVSDAEWVPPSLDLLDPAVESQTMDEATLRSKAEQIRQKLANFGIEVTMQDVNIGPSVMQYTLKPSEGVKLSKITNLKHDLALALSAKSIRIEAPIPGRDVVGIEIPNDKRISVRMKELLMSDTFAKTKSNLRLALGRDVAGHPLIADLAKMPHLLVAGQTGSGKSVGINSFLLSLIYQNSPNDLRLILVDPKRVELVPYNGIPHLLTPVINDTEKTVSALKWAVAEMTRRYIELSKVHVRNITEYNEKPETDKMPYIVIVIDELADLMMASGKEVEGAICRLAQMARAVGIHLIIATQRPSVDVITGLIKANIPTRISFRVAQGVDSKTILDSVGAEDLLGQGDMLFIPPGQSDPVRVQGAFLSTDEVRRVTNAIKLDLGDEAPEYNDDITDKSKTAGIEIPGVKMQGAGGNTGSDSTDDQLVIAAARVLVETGKASTSLLQRRLSLGFARAARIMDLLEERGFVGAGSGAKAREIYVTAERLTELEGGTSDMSAQRRADAILDEMGERRGDN